MVNGDGPYVQVSGGASGAAEQQREWSLPPVF